MPPILAPSPGESITQVLLATWLVDDGSYVEKDTEIAEIESDKATLVVYATEAGVLKQVVKAGESVNVGGVIGEIVESLNVQSPKSKVELQREISQPPTTNHQPPITNSLKITPLAKKVIEKEGVDVGRVKALHKDRIRVKDVQNLGKGDVSEKADGRPFRRVKMSPLRMKLAERLVSVKNETAMLTTFNEVDMSAVIAYRNEHKKELEAQYGFNAGFISFFAKAAALAFREFPQINAAIDGDEIVYYDYADICIAVDTPKGLLAPAIRDVQQLSLMEIESHIRDFGKRAKENKIRIDELRGGTFTITNGGTFGSLLSTPIINPPQSAILGLHKIQERPVAINGKIEIRPMMYIALSYDHRLIDGKESVGFVMKVKEGVEDKLVKLVK